MPYNILEETVAWLSTMGLRASTRPPKDAPESPSEFVTVELVGGDVRDLVDHPRLAIQCWGPNEYVASSMAEAVKVAALTGPLPRGVHRFEVDTRPYRFYDESTRCPRYQLVIDATCQLVDEDEAQENPHQNPNIE